MLYQKVVTSPLLGDPAVFGLFLCITCGFLFPERSCIFWVRCVIWKISFRKTGWLLLYFMELVGFFFFSLSVVWMFVFTNEVLIPAVPLILTLLIIYCILVEFHLPSWKLKLFYQVIAHATSGISAWPCRKKDCTQFASWTTSAWPILSLYNEHTEK